MEETGRCKRTDGKKWRCKQPVVDGKSYCESHIHRQKKQKIEAAAAAAALKSKNKKNKDVGGCVVKDLKFGTMEIEQQSADVKKNINSPGFKVGVHSSKTLVVPERPIRSKNVEPKLNAAIKMLPSIKENVKASAKITKKCHWCSISSFPVLVKCLTCKKHYFCQECIERRFHSKVAIMRKCPVCQGDCSCRTCTKGKQKGDKSQDIVVYDPKKKFDKSQQLHMIRELLPVMEKMNLEKMVELDIEVKDKGVSHDELQVPVATYPQPKECSFCKACIPDVHRSCDQCSYILCIHCCQEFRDGYLRSGLEYFKNMKMVRSRKSRKISWRVYVNGSITCPPKNLGGCGAGILNLTCFSQFHFTNDLEASGKEIVDKYKRKKPFRLSESSPCLLCDGHGDLGSEKSGDLIKNDVLYFLTKKEFMGKNLEHFMKHWGSGQPIIIREMLQSQPDLNWEFGCLLCEYLKKSAESRYNTEPGTSKSALDWCEVQFSRKQIFSGGITHENVWKEFLHYKLRFSLGFLQDHFPNNHTSVMQGLPVQEYMNPLTGYLNLEAYPPHQSHNLNLGSYIDISYGGAENLLATDMLKKLLYHAYDVVNILAHASQHPIPERKLNEVKILMHKYNSQDHMKSSKIKNRNNIEELFINSSRAIDTCNGEVDLTLRLETADNGEVGLLSDDSSIEDSDDEDLSRVNDTSGIHWDIFRREDVPKLVEYLTKYSDKLIRHYGSPKKVVHPLFDEVFYLNDDHKTRLKEEFDVKPWSFEQDVGEAVIVPAGCPYQTKKIKSCVNVVLEFISPESASECVKVTDELRLLPLNHKAKGRMLQVKEMVINRMHEAIKDIREVSQVE
uniref:lysine-specific demethylase JMJ25-like n=1 Tax=Erigeron canadensis TaxID=72917 RepID=UPI001CB8FDD1|nr:lysine-specific demethylase JMJ25-like [Erigeron canadensis]